MTEIWMRRFLATAIVFIFGCSSGLAQVGPAPGMRATSPLGTTNFNASSGPVGIGLGATELDSGGLSPLAGAMSCPMTTTPGTGMGGSSSGMTAPGIGGSGSGYGTGLSGSSSTFDGGGGISGSSIASTCAPAGAGSSQGIVIAPPAGLGLGTGSRNTIPLGATELNSPGESTTIGVPVPGVSDRPCPGASTMSGMSGSTGTTSTNGC